MALTSTKIILFDWIVIIRYPWCGVKQRECMFGIQRVIIIMISSPPTPPPTKVPVPMAAND